MLNVLIITNTIFNVFFGLTCGFIVTQFIKNHNKLKKVNNAVKPKK